MHRPRTFPLLGVFLVLAFAVAACGGGDASSAPAADAGGHDGGGGETVSLAGGQFSPSELTIAAGTAVTFTDTANHTVTEGSDGQAVDDPLVDEQGGEDVVVAFEEAGTFQITCRIHPNMNMTVTVEG